jgi:hypothetical protein
MPKKKSPKTASVLALKDVSTRTVLHGDCFRAFLDEARSIGNEVAARREYDEDVVEYLTAKGLFDEWAIWRAKKRAPKP